MIIVTWYVSRGLLYVIMGPWNVNRGLGMWLWDIVMGLWDR